LANLKDPSLSVPPPVTRKLPGNKQYDPVKLGLDISPLKGATEFRTDLPGNSNREHEFNDEPKGNGVIGRKLSEEERIEIIEYLKTLSDRFSPFTKLEFANSANVMSKGASIRRLPQKRRRVVLSA
jgi:hypothetical protein